VPNKRALYTGRRRAETQGNNKKSGNNSELVIAETQGDNKKGPIGDPWR
jgi:hypothetical protein